MAEQDNKAVDTQIKALQEQIKGQDEKIATLLKGHSATSKQNETLIEQVEELSGKHASLGQDNAKLNEQVEALGQSHANLLKENAELKKLMPVKATENKPVPRPILPANNQFEVNGKNYRFKAPSFVHVGRTPGATAKQVTAVDAMNDKQILTELVERGSGVIEEIED